MHNNVNITGIAGIKSHEKLVYVILILSWTATFTHYVYQKRQTLPHREHSQHTHVPDGAYLVFNYSTLHVLRPWGAYGFPAPRLSIISLDLWNLTQI